MAEEEQTANPLITFIEVLLGGVLLFAIGAYVLTTFYNVFPTNPTSYWIKAIYLDVFGFFDISFIFIFFFIILVDLWTAYKNPSVTAGIGNIIFILAYVFIFLNVKNDLLAGLTGISFSAILPHAAATLTNNFFAVFIFFALILCTILAFRKK